MSANLSRQCKWCGRPESLPNPIKRHALAASPTLPFRSGKSLECKSCYNAIGIQAGGDQGYRAKLAKECGTQKDNEAQRERTEQWEAKYDASVGGRVLVGNRGLNESAQIVNTNYMQLERTAGIVWPVNLAAGKLGRTPSRTETRIYQCGSQKVKGVVLPEQVGETLPFGCFRLKQGSMMQVQHVKEYDNDRQQLREGQVAATASSLSKRALGTKTTLQKTSSVDENGKEVEGLGLISMFFKSAPASSSQVQGDEDGSDDDVVDLLGTVPSLVKKGRTLKRKFSNTVSEPDDVAPKPKKEKTGDDVAPKPKKEKTGDTTKSPGLQRVANGNPGDVLLGSLKVLLAKAENMADQVSSRGLLSVTSKAVMGMVEKLEAKLTSEEFHLVKGEGRDGFMELETNLKASCSKLTWAQGFICDLANSKVESNTIVASLLTMVKYASFVGFPAYSVPENIVMVVSQRCWFDSQTKEWDERCVMLVTPTTEMVGDVGDLTIGFSSVIVQFNRASFVTLQEATLLNTIKGLAREPIGKLLYTSEHGRQVTAFAKFKLLVEASSSNASKLLVDGLAEDVQALQVACVPNSTAELVQMARTHIADFSKRLSSKPLRTSPAVVECIARLDSRLLALKLNEQVIKNLTLISELELPDMTCFNSIAFDTVEPQYVEYAKAVQRFKEAMAKAPPTFESEYQTLYTKTKEQVSSFFVVKSKHVFDHIATCCQDSLDKYITILESILAASDTTSSDLQVLMQSAVPEALVCTEKQLPQWKFGDVCLDAAHVACYEKAEDERIFDFGWLHTHTVVAASLALGGAVNNKAMQDRLLLHPLSHLSGTSWLPACVDAGNRAAVEQRVQTFATTAAKIEGWACQRWLSTRVRPSIARAFCDDQIGSGSSCEVMGEQSPWLEKVGKAFAEEDTPPVLEADEKNILLKMLLGDRIPQIGKVVLDNVEYDGVYIALCILFTPLLPVANIPDKLPEAKWDEPAGSDMSLRKVTSLISLCEELRELVKTLPGNYSLFMDTRLEVISTWLSHCGVQFMSARCDQVISKVKEVKVLVGCPTFKKLDDNLGQFDFDNVQDKAQQETKQMLLHIATKSEEMRDLVPLHNVWDDMVKWPGAAKQKLKAIDQRFSAKVDHAEAQVRNVAVSQLHLESKRIIANCTAIQALLKSLRGTKA